MPPALTIVARIEAKADSIDLVKSELVKLVEPTRAETGCLQYDLHQDNDHRAVFLFVENWESRQLWQEHVNSVHLKAFQAAVEDALDSLVIHEMSRID